MTLTRAVLSAALVLALAACQKQDDAAVAEETPPPAPAPVDTTPAPPPLVTPDGGQVPPATANVMLQGKAGTNVGGALSFIAEDGGVRVTGQLTGLPANGTHGFHVHETGDCSAADFSSAGSHFNPGNSAHGDRSAGGEHHAGDIPNQVADASGNATVDQRLAGLEIGTGGPNDIVGRAVIVHEKADDYATQPTGDAGGRLACGVIAANAVETAPPVPTPVPGGEMPAEGTPADGMPSDGVPPATDGSTPPAAGEQVEPTDDGSAG